MIDEFNEAIEKYQTKWQALIKGREDKELFERAQPNAIGWKTSDVAEFDQRFAELRERCEQVHLVWLNERWIATMILRDTSLAWGIQIIKLMQRRPGSTDEVGLDHIDFYAPDFSNAATMQAKEPDLKWSDEVNGVCKWTSLWFDNTEAKLRRESVIDVCIAEMNAVNKKILGQET
jgi:hypothetical protein